MKYVLVTVAIFVLIWLLRNALERLRGPTTRRPAAPRGPQAMLACAQCGVHLPRDEALPGRGGAFCTEAHRASYERANPAP